LEYQKIIDQCQQGDRRAQKALFDHFAPKMLYLCRRYAVDMNEAHDMLQEGFIRTFGNLDIFRNEGLFEGWVRRIFVNSAIKYYRRTKVHNGATDLQTIVAYESSDADALDVLSEKEILNLLTELPSGYKMVFNLFAIEGFSHKEIAKMLGVEESTSRSQLVKARKMLQSKVNEFQRVTL
jgi:RNA polymerase sigma-70 factor (ECF subfamily)